MFAAAGMMMKIQFRFWTAIHVAIWAPTYQYDTEDSKSKQGCRRGSIQVNKADDRNRKPFVAVIYLSGWLVVRVYGSAGEIAAAVAIVCRPDRPPGERAENYYIL